MLLEHFFLLFLHGLFCPFYFILLGVEIDMNPLIKEACSRVT